jgi:hypothetical protein
MSTRVDGSSTRPRATFFRLPRRKVAHRDFLTNVITKVSKAYEKPVTKCFLTEVSMQSRYFIYFYLKMIDPPIPVRALALALSQYFLYIEYIRVKMGICSKYILVNSELFSICLLYQFISTTSTVFTTRAHRPRPSIQFLQRCMATRFYMHHTNNDALEVCSFVCNSQHSYKEHQSHALIARNNSARTCAFHLYILGTCF